MNGKHIRDFMATAIRRDLPKHKNRDDSSCPLVAASSRSSSSGPSRRDGADHTLLYSVHPHLFCDLRLSQSDLRGRYAAFGDTFRVHVTVFGVQQSLDFVQVRLCLSDTGLAGFGSGEMRRKKTSVHIAPPRASERCPD